MIKIDDRQVLQNVLGDNAVMGKAVCSGIDRARCIELAGRFRSAPGPSE
jgi:hypothetical protein